MANKYITTQQYEPLRTPSNWNSEEKKLVQQLTDRLDDLYRRFNRLRFEDLGKKLQSTISSKVDNSTFQTSITQTEEAIELKADQTTVNELGQTVSSQGTAITQNAQAIALKASQTTVEALTGRVTTAESTIAQTPTQIAAAVSAIRIPGANIISEGNGPFIGLATQYDFKTWDLTGKIKPYTKYTLTMKASPTVNNSVRAYILFDDDWTRVSVVDIAIWNTIGYVTFTPPTTFSTVSLLLFNYPSGNGNSVVCDWVVLAEGDKAAASWQPCPDDTYRKVAGITIDPELGVDVYGKQFTVRDVQGADPTFIVDNTQKIVKARNAQFDFLTLNGPLTGTGNNVLTRDDKTLITIQPGPNAQAVIDAQVKYRGLDTTFYFPPGSYPRVEFRGFQGWGVIILQFAPGVVMESLYIVNNSALFLIIADTSDISKYAVIAPTISSRAIIVQTSTVYTDGGLRITGKARSGASDGTAIGILADYGAKLIGHNFIIERIRDQCVYATKCSVVYLRDIRGGQSGGDYSTLANLSYGVIAYEGAVVTLNGTTVIANVSNLENWGAIPIAGNPIPTASPGVYMPPSTQAVQYIHNSSKYCDLPDTASMGTASSVWSPSAPRGGRWDSQKQRYAGMWLLQRNGGGVEDIRTLLIGKTVISATLRVHCVDCWVGSVVHDLYFMTVGSLPVGGNAPNSRLVDTGVDITLTQGQDTVLDVTAFIQGRIAAGDDFYGFGLGLAGSYVKMDATCTLDIVYQ